MKYSKPAQQHENATSHPDMAPDRFTDLLSIRLNCEKRTKWRVRETGQAA